MSRIRHNFLLNFKKLMFHRRLIATSAKCLSDKECKKFNVIQEDCNTPYFKPVPKIVVVGAGVAGLSAATRLYDAGYNVTVLEATERPGGRIFSCWLGDNVAEIGAQWITGSSLSNSVVPLASQAGLLESHHEYNYRKGLFMTSDGHPLDPLISTHAYLTFNQLVKQAYALFNIGASQSHGSLMNFFTVRIGQELNNFPVNQRKDVTNIMYGMTNKISNRWGVELHSLSADLFGTYTPMIGKTIGLPSGFVSVLSPLVKAIPKDKIRYSNIVKEIVWRGSQTSRVTINTCEHCSYTADYVIVTVSLGVLKNQAKSMFIPNLPCEKSEAIDKIGFGNINKVFIEYKKPFWVPNHGPIKFAWTPEELCRRDTWLKGIHCLEEVPGSRQILMATVAGKYADAVENLNDIDIAENVTALLRRFTRDPTIPYPDSVLRSKWRASPYFYGATSYMGLCSTLGHQLDLGRPVPYPAGKDESMCVIPKIFFAGEAMCKGFYSTVHGARLSGLKAADDIITLTEKLGGSPSVREDVTENEDDTDCDKSCP